MLTDHVRDAAPAVLALYRTAVDARNREGDELIATGTLQPLQLTSDPELRAKADHSLLAAAANGRKATFHDPSFFDDTEGVLCIREVEDSHYGLRLADLGAALDADATGWRASEEYAMQVLTWFRLTGCLTDAELAAESKLCLTGTAEPR